VARDASVVARLTKAERSHRAVVHTMFTPADTVTLLGRLGYQAELKKEGQRPLIVARQGAFGFVVTLDVPADDHGGFHCLDFVATVGTVSETTNSSWMWALNELNSLSRIARGWVDGDGNVDVGTSLLCTGGLTEDFVATAIGAWHHAAIRLLGGPSDPTGRKLRTRKTSAPTALDDAEPRNRPVVVH
jgi:Putative bacterial sensory transduction regulator